MGNFNLAEDGVAVVGEDNAAHRVKQHLEHGLGTEARPNNISDTVVVIVCKLLKVATGVGTVTAAKQRRRR